MSDDDYESPSDVRAKAMFDRDRPYDGQPHTVHGVRGSRMVEGLTMRDVHDAYVAACYLASGMPVEDWPDDLYELPFDRMDPIAIEQNLGCMLERYMGIFPNVPRLKQRD